MSNNTNSCEHSGDEDEVKTGADFKTGILEKDKELSMKDTFSPIFKPLKEAFENFKGSEYDIPYFNFIKRAHLFFKQNEKMLEMELDEMKQILENESALEGEIDEIEEMEEVDLDQDKLDKACAEAVYCLDSFHNKRNVVVTKMFNTSGAIIVESTFNNRKSHTIKA